MPKQVLGSPNRRRQVVKSSTCGENIHWATKRSFFSRQYPPHKERRGRVKEEQRVVEREKSILCKGEKNLNRYDIDLLPKVIYLSKRTLFADEGVLKCENHPRPVRSDNNELKFSVTHYREVLDLQNISPNHWDNGDAKEQKQLLRNTSNWQQPQIYLKYLEDSLQFLKNYSPKDNKQYVESNLSFTHINRDHDRWLS